LKTQTIT